MKSCLEIWVLIIDVFWLEIRAGLWSMPQATTRGRPTCLSLISDNNSWSMYISSTVCLCTLFATTVIFSTLAFDAAPGCYVHQHLYRLFHLFGCRVIYLPVTSPHLAVSLTAPYHFENFCILAGPFLLFLIFWYISESFQWTPAWFSRTVGTTAAGPHTGQIVSGSLK